MFRFNYVEGYGMWKKLSFYFGAMTCIAMIFLMGGMVTLWYMGYSGLVPRPLMTALLSMWFFAVIAIVCAVKAEGPKGGKRQGLSYSGGIQTASY